MKVSHKGRKQKGSRLERKIAARLRQKGLDRDAKRMPLSGGFSHLKGDIYTSLPWHFEAKNTERLRFWPLIEQASSQCPMGLRWVGVVSANHRPLIAIMDFEDWLDLVKTEQDHLDDIADRD